MNTWTGYGVSSYGFAAAAGFVAVWVGRFGVVEVSLGHQDEQQAGW